MYIFSVNTERNPPFVRFIGGISNGADWYSLNGGMQDWNYLQCGTMEITIEMGCDKYPTPSLLLQDYRDHYLPLIDYIKNSRQGFWGRVTDSAGSPIEGTLVMAPEIGINISARADGHFWRVAAPGDYKFTVTAPGFRSHVYHVTVGKVDWLALSEPINIQLLLGHDVPVKEGLHAQSDMVVKRVVALVLLVALSLVIVGLGLLWRRNRLRSHTLTVDEKVEYQGLIDNASDSDHDEY